MAVTNTPIHVQAVNNASVSITNTANTNTDGSTGTYTTILTAGANGSKVETIKICSVGTSVAEKVRLFVGGILWKELVFAANTPSNTLGNLEQIIDCTQPGNTLYLSGSVVLKANVNTGTGSQFAAHASYGNY